LDAVVFEAQDLVDEIEEPLAMVGFAEREGVNVPEQGSQLSEFFFGIGFKRFACGGVWESLEELIEMALVKLVGIGSGPALSPGFGSACDILMEIYELAGSGFRESV